MGFTVRETDLNNAGGSVRSAAEGLVSSVVEGSKSISNALLYLVDV
jgi:hypothetical protein